LFALGILLAVLSAWFVEHRSEPSWLGHRLMPWISWIGAAVAFIAVSHVVTDRSILPFVTTRVALERQALYGLFALLLLLPAVFGPQDRSPIRRLLRSWPMASIGVISYGIYLWHVGMLNEFMKWTGYTAQMVPFWILTLATLALSIAVASASYFGLERPILRLKGRISWWDRKPRSTAELQPAESSQSPPET
jgi:peptidoglycan/LPS O-acetylase OafA/YrhL